MIEIIQPYLETIILSLLSLISAFVAAALIEIRKRVIAWIESRTSKEQREFLKIIAAEAVSYAETVMDNAGAQYKYVEASRYLHERLAAVGIHIEKEEIKASIEHALFETYNSKK